MSKEEIIKILRTYKNEYAEKYGINGIGVFGSVIHDNIREDSDVDVVVNFSEDVVRKGAGCIDISFV